jgi:PAS domain S-box-containing protein
MTEGEGAVVSEVPRSVTAGVYEPLPAELLAAAIEHVGHPMFIKDRAFRYVFVNSALCALVGCAAEAMLGRTDYEIFSADEADFFRLKDTEMFATGSRVTIDEERLTDAGGKRHVLTTTKVPLRDAGGAVTHLVGILHDITRLKAAEEVLRLSNEELERRVRDRTAALEAAQGKLVRRERLAVLGQLAGGLAHQIRNPLGAITNAAYVLQHSPGAQEGDAARAVAIILAEAWDANRIITDLLDYARVRPPVRRPVSLREIVERALGTQTTPSNVRVSLEVPPAPLVSVDPDQVRDAVENLLRNAFEAMPTGGDLRISALAASGELALSITDSGVGIPCDVQEQLFEPLVTTKPLGLGLGLTTTRALVENQGGSITFESALGRGTRFEVKLPLADVS